MTSIDETIGAPHVPVVERARRTSAGWVLLDWLRSFGAASAQVVLTIAVLLGLLATAPVAFGQISTTVMSDSMEPGLHAGDVVVLRPVTSNRVRIGQVVLVDDPDYPGRLRLHRLFDVRHGSLVLKGDANATPDSSSVSASKLHGVGWLRVPWIGLPVLWMRDRTYLPLGLAALALVLLAWLAAADRQDEDGHRRDEPTKARRGLRRLLQRVGRLLRVFRRSRVAQSAGISLLLAGLFVAAPLAQPGSAAAFNGSTTSPGNSIATGAFDCPTRPFASASTVLYYSYMPASGTPEPDVATGAMPGTLGSGVTRQVGNCSGNASPAITVDGSATGFVAANTSESARNANFGISLWFNTATNAGVLASFGATNAASPATAGDRQIAFTGGKLSFAMGRPGSGTNVGCSIAAAPATGVWHLAVLSFTGGSSAVLTLDNNVSTCTATISGLSTLASGYWRFGGDLPLATGVTNTYVGALDETAVYAGGFSSSGVTTIWTAGR